MARAALAALLCLVLLSAAGCGSDGSADATQNVAVAAGLREHDCETTGTTTQGQHAVSVHVTGITPDDSGELFAIDEDMEAGIAAADAGEYDGNGIAMDGSGADFFAYGPDADELWKAMKRILAKHSIEPGSSAVRAYGDITAHPDTKQTTCQIN